MNLVKSSSSILRKFLIFNSVVFLFLGLFTFFYLQAIQPNLVKQRVEKHTIIINNTSNHIERLKINFEEKELKNFLLSTRFLFQNLERVQFYNSDGILIGDTNIIDLDQNVFIKSDAVIEEDINNKTLEVEKKITENKLIREKENIKNLIIVTFPHKKHISNLAEPEDKIYNHNISNIIDELIGENQKTVHLNFTKLIK